MREKPGCCVCFPSLNVTHSVLPERPAVEEPWVESDPAHLEGAIPAA